MEKDKLNYKRTMFIGCAFFTIMLLWSVYNFTTPSLLSDMGISDGWIGVIMAADNLFALFMLPLFGTLSDKTNTKIGKRMPYIIVGTILAAMAFPFIAVFAMQNNLVATIIVIALVLTFMNIYRAPAVALMPDVTPKKHRSVANGIINLMGGIGGICAFIAIQIFFKGDTKIVPFIMTSVLMIVALVILYTKVKENKIKEEIKIEDDVIDVEVVGEKKNKLSKEKIRSLLFILAAVFFWFFAVNAVETFWSIYSHKVLNAPNEGAGAIALTIFTVSAIAIYLPAGILATKIGRKKTILIGILCILGAFAAGYLLTLFMNEWNIVPLIILFIFAGAGWALINSNSYPMVVEMANETNGGKFTGFYYTASMLAQTITPAVAGFLMDHLDRTILFPYAVIFLALSFVFMFFSSNYKKKEKKSNGN